MSLTKAAQPLAEDFLARVRAGAIALHPTDTLPGLTCWPGTGLAALARFKGRRQGQAFLYLAADISQALSLWQPLPASWATALGHLWPGPLTVVAPPSDLGTKLQQPELRGSGIAVRVPALSSANSWYLEVLKQQPLPSTSANATGETPAADWNEAVSALAGKEGVYIPAAVAQAASEVPPQPSTMIRIAGDRQYCLLREGALAPDAIEDAFSST